MFCDQYTNLTKASFTFKIPYGSRYMSPKGTVFYSQRKSFVMKCQFSQN